jgi:hypothetical protein
MDREDKPAYTECKRAPYAECMTAPGLLNSDRTANCKCPVFYGNFQLVGTGAQCSLGGRLVPSASYFPLLDTIRNHQQRYRNSVWKGGCRRP